MVGMWGQRSQIPGNIDVQLLRRENLPLRSARARGQLATIPGDKSQQAGDGDKSI